MGMWYKTLLTCGSLLLLPACSTWDMHGQDPVDYYAEHPIKNRVTRKSEAHLVTFESGAEKLSKAEIERFRHNVNQRSMLSVEKVEINLPKAELHNKERRAALERVLKHLGYQSGGVTFTASEAVGRNQAVVNLTFAEVIPPDCPDWRKSPVHNYSNARHANFGCATEVNLGLMVADPRDLERGTGELPPALSERGDRALRAYHAGGVPAEGGAAATPAPADPAASGVSDQAAEMAQ